MNTVCKVCAVALLFAAAGVDAAERIAYQDRPDPRMSARRAAAVDINEAAGRLARARNQREQGVPPLPGESAPGADASAVNYRYWQRQEKLRRMVEDAQRRYNESRQAQLLRR